MLNYQIALTNVPFDNAYTNVRYFRTRQEQEGYFNVNTLFVNSISVNFNVGNLIKTSLTINAEEEHLNRLLSCNYLIVKNNSKVKDLNYFYYFITNSFQLSGNQISVDVELDVINTYLLDVEFTDCMIKRGHLNRFLDNQDGTVSFDGTINSKLFEREPIQNVAKKLSKQESLKFNFESSDNAKVVENWINKNVVGWLYYYLVSPQDLKFFDFDDNHALTGIIDVPNYNFYDDEDYGTSQEMAPLCVVCVPVYKVRGGVQQGIILKDSNGNLHSWDTIKYFQENNNDSSYIVSAKFSYLPPFESSSGQVTYSETTNSIIIDINTSDSRYGECPGMHFVKTRNTTQGNVVFYVKKTPKTKTTNNFISEHEFTFNKSDIINSNKNIKFNPKLLSNDYLEIILKDTTGQNFVYDLQKINTNQFNVLYDEALTGDVTKGYARLNINSVCYPKGNTKNLTGLVLSNDESIMVANDQLAQMLANNKNYFLQTGLKLGSAFVGSAITAGIGAAEMVATGGAMGAGKTAGGAMGMVGSVLGAFDKILSIDNMKSAPDSIKGASGNSIFNAMYNNFGLSIEEYDILENEKEMINDFMCQYGFTVNRLGNIKDYLDIRKYYNYVQAEIEEVKSNKTLISNQVKNKFVEIFKNGIRFWNTDAYSYEKENYEKWLEA